MARKASEQPIWLLVALLLAVVVGIAMFNMISKGTGIFGVFTSTQGGESERIAMENFCKNWIRPDSTDVNGNLNPRASEPAYREREKQTDIFRKTGWLSSEKVPETKAYVEAGPPSGCDCVVFLATPAANNVLSPTKAKQLLSDESGTASTYAPESCNIKAQCVAKQSITEIAGFFANTDCTGR